MLLKRIKRRILYELSNIRYGHKGKNSKVIKPMRIIGKDKIFIGDNVTILNLARMETIHEWGGVNFTPKLIIESGSSIEQCCHIIVADELVIEKNVVISAFVYIADCQERFDQNSRIMESDLTVKKVRIKEGAFIGIGARILPGVTIGKRAVIGANAVVTKDVPDGEIWAGVPAKYIRDNVITD